MSESYYGVQGCQVPIGTPGNQRSPGYQGTRNPFEIQGAQGAQGSQASIFKDIKIPEVYKKIEIYSYQEYKNSYQNIHKL